MKALSRFPSFDQVVRNAVSTLGRFPLALLSAAVAVGVGVTLAQIDSPQDQHLLHNILLVSMLGLPLFTVATLFAEHRIANKTTRLLIQGLGVILLVAYYLTLPEDISSPWVHLVRYALLAVGLHFLVAFLPYLGRDKAGGFWEYNKSLFLRFLIAALFSAVIYSGLTVALAASDHLFGFDVDDKRYFQLWIVVTGLFQTWVFLAGIPKNLGDLTKPTEYPKGLKVFTQFVLLPLVALYFIILISYEAKIILSWNWPKGWVSELVLWYSVVGILAMLLLHPLRERQGNKWIQAFGVWFFRALVPLVLMLLLAIMRRIADYGVTENRYFVLAMAIGLVVVMLHFLISKARDIRIIPIVLCSLAFVSAFGPWGAFAVAERSQQSRLTALLTDNGLLVDGSIDRLADEPPAEVQADMSSIIEYLNEWHGLESFSGWLSDSTLTSLDTLENNPRLEQIAESLGFTFMRWKGREVVPAHFYISTSDDEPLMISGYDHLVSIELYAVLSSDSDQVHMIGTDSCVIYLDQNSATLIVASGRNITDSSTVRFPLGESVSALLDSLDYYGQVQVPVDALTFEMIGIDFDAKVIIRSVEGTNKVKGVEINSLSGQLLLRLH